MPLVEPAGKNSLKDYIPIVGEAEIESIRGLAERVRGLSVVHVNSTNFGGGVAEILHRMVPLMRSVGLDARWAVIEANQEFFKVTKFKLHNGLQGADVTLTDDERELYLSINKLNAGKLNLDTDFVVIHDPQPLAIAKYYSRKANSCWIWRCHIDLSTPNETIWNFVSKFTDLYDAAVFSMQEFIREGMRVRKISIIPPSIDPLSDKNRPLRESEVNLILERYDVDPERPIIAQVGRFDPWKDPLGVIEVYRIVKKEVPDVQLLMVASMASDDPEAWYLYEKCVRRAGEDYDVHFLTNLIGVGDIEVNAFQRASDVVLMKSIREGFGLAVSEALWKGVPVVGTPAGGIKIQVIDGHNGFLVNSEKEAAERVVFLLKHPEEAKRMGENGREHVRKNFLITRHLKDYLKLFSGLRMLFD